MSWDAKSLLTAQRTASGKSLLKSSNIAQNKPHTSVCRPRDPNVPPACCLAFSSVSCVLSCVHIGVPFETLTWRDVSHAAGADFFQWFGSCSARLKRDIPRPPLTNLLDLSVLPNGSNVCRVLRARPTSLLFTFSLLFRHYVDMADRVDFRAWSTLGISCGRGERGATCPERPLRQGHTLHPCNGMVCGMMSLHAQCCAYRGTSLKRNRNPP